MSCQVGEQYETAEKSLQTVKSSFWFLWGVVDLNIQLRKI